MKLALAALLGAAGIACILAGASNHVATWLDVSGLAAIFLSLIISN